MTGYPFAAVRCWVGIGLASWVLIANTGAQVVRDAETMAADGATLWQVVDRLTREFPLTKARVEGVLGAVLTERENSGNPLYLSYRSNRQKLNDGTVIANVDFRIKRTGNDVGFIVVDLEGTCIDYRAVNSHYQGLHITGVPRGGSLNEAITHAAILPWGKLSFGFARRNPDCLAWITVEPSFPDSSQR